MSRKFTQAYLLYKNKDLFLSIWFKKGIFCIRIYDSGALWHRTNTQLKIVKKKKQLFDFCARWKEYLKVHFLLDMYSCMFRKPYMYLEYWFFFFAILTHTVFTGYLQSYYGICIDIVNKWVLGRNIKYAVLKFKSF